MNDQTKQAMTMALEAQEAWERDDVNAYYKLKALGPALREALAQPQGEPLAWVDKASIEWISSADRSYAASVGTALCKTPNEEATVPLYTAPPSVEAMRIETLEKAAKVCEAEAERHEENTKYEENADYANRCLVYGKHIRTCAAAIRSMK